MSNRDNLAAKGTESRRRRRTALRRRGAAFLLLVTMVLLVVIGSTQSMVRSEIMSRRGEVDRMRLRSMLTAVEVARQIELSPGQSLRLPLVDDDEAAGPDQRHIEVTVADGQLSAQWVENNKVVDQIRRNVEHNAEPSE